MNTLQGQGMPEGEDRSHNLREFVETIGGDLPGWDANLIEPGFLPPKEDTERDRIIPRPSYVVHLPDAQTGLVQDAIVYSEKGQKVDLGMPNLAEADDPSRVRIFISTRSENEGSANEYLLDGNKLFDMQASEAAGRPMAYIYEDRTELPTVTIGKTKLLAQKGNGMKIERIERSINSPFDPKQIASTYEDFREDPITRLEKRLGELEENYRAEQLASNKTLFAKAVIAAGGVATKASASLKNRLGNGVDKLKSLNKQRAAKTLGVVAVAALAAGGAVAIKNEITSNNGKNKIVAAPKPKLPSKVNLNGRNPWVVTDILLRKKYGIIPSNPRISEADEKILDFNNIDESKGEDKQLPDDFVLKVPGDL